MLLLLSPITAISGLKSEQETELLANKAMNEINKGNFDGAIELLRPHWPLPKPEIDGLAYKIKQQQPTIDERFGKPIGYILVCDQNIASVVKRFNYMQKFEKHALIWTFDFYKPNNEWVINTFSFHDRWQKLFDSKCSNKTN